MKNYWHWPTIISYSSIVLTSIVIATIISKYNKKKASISIFQVIIVFLPLILLSGLRDGNTGIDLIRYIPDYIKSVSLNLNMISREPFFSLYLFIINRIFNGNVQAFLFITSLIPFLFLSAVIKKEYKMTGIIIPLIYYVCLLYFRSFSMIRQGIALSIVLYAFTFIKKKSIYKYMFLSILAAGFHYTAIIAIPIYFYSSGSKMGLIKRITFITGLIIFILFGDIILSFLFSNIDSKYANLGNRRVSFGIGNFIINLPMFLIVYMNKNKLIRLNSNLKPYILIYLLNIAIAQILYVNPLFERFTLYTQVVLIFILPSLYIIYKRKYGFLAKFVFLLSFIIYFFYTLYFYIYKNPYDIVPYGFLE